MVKLFQIIFVSFFALCCCDSSQQSTTPESSVTESSSSSNSVPSTSRVYFHQAFSRTTSGVDEGPARSQHEQKTTIYPSSIQAVNKSLEDAALKMSETRHLLGYEPETWNNRYTPPIPLDVLASETDEDEQDNDDRADDDDVDNDSDESNDDGQTHDGHQHSDNADHNERDDDEVPENDGEVTEEYNDENAQKVIDEIDGDIHGQEGNGQNDDFSFAATVQRPTIAKPESGSDKQKRCKTIYREVNGFSPHSKLLSDDEDFDFQWRRKRSLDSKSEPKEHGPIGQAQSSSYMITRECTFDDAEDDSGDDSSEISDLKHKKNDDEKYNKINSKSFSGTDAEKPGIASSSSWSLRTPQLLSSNPSLPAKQPSSQSSSSPSSSPSSARTSHTTGSRSESRFIPIFGWKKHEFITEDEPGTYSDSMSNDFQTESNTFRPMNNDFGSHEQNDFWLQPNAQPWNDWNHFSGPNSGYTNAAGDNSQQGPAQNSVDDDDGSIWGGSQLGSEFVEPNNAESPAVPYESYFEWTPRKGHSNQNRPHSDDGDDDGESQQEDEHSDESGDDDGVNSEEDEHSRMDNSPADPSAGSVRRMFTQHIRQRRSVESYSSTLNNANFAWTQPAQKAHEQLQHDTPYIWNYFQQEHPHKDDDGAESENTNGEQQNAELFERKPVHEEGGDTTEDDEGLSDENQENDDESTAAHNNGSNDPENYSNSYDGGNHEEYNIDYDSDRLADNGAGYNGGKLQNEHTMGDDDEYEKF